MDEYFEKILKFVLSREGGYSNHPADKGGETNKGITSAVYNNYLKRKNLPSKSVKNITENEVREIYHTNYYKASGADKIKNPKLAAVVFDTSVNMGVSRAKSFLEKSGGDVSLFLKLRKEKYIEFAKCSPSQKVFLQGWFNRLAALEKFINSM